MQNLRKVVEESGKLTFTTRLDNQRPWWRDLDLDGSSLYRIGNVCDTCEALFEKYKDAEFPLTPRELAEKLRAGLVELSPTIIDTIAKILPKGEYAISLLEFHPALIKFKDPEYYIWENTQPAKVPGEWWPKVERLKPWWFAQPKQSPGFQDEALYEAVLPLLSENQLNQVAIDQYISAFQTGHKPTTLALSVIDMRSVSGRAFDWKLIHFLLDGHHKLMAASQTGKPLTLLSFLNISESFAPNEWIKKSLQVRYQA